MFDGYATLPHFAAHALPVHEALPEALRGTFYGPRADCPWGPQFRTQGDTGGPVLVASGADAGRFRHRPVIYMEHGAGQRYDADPASAEHPSYIGGGGKDHVRLFLVPGPLAAAGWRDRYPGVPVAQVGCPKLDPWHRLERGRHPGSTTGRPTVAVTFHWDCPLVPETSSAWSHWRHTLGPLADLARARDWRLLGHQHPRWNGRLNREYARHGIELCPDLTDVLDLADVLVADNTSALYEFASLGRPVIVLNAPWYRRSVEHGLRFWSHVPGPQADGYDDLVGHLERLLTDGETPAEADERRRIVCEVYARTDGTAAATAAAAITEAFDAQG